MLKLEGQEVNLFKSLDAKKCEFALPSKAAMTNCKKEPLLPRQKTLPWHYHAILKNKT